MGGNWFFGNREVEAVGGGRYSARNRSRQGRYRTVGRSRGRDRQAGRFAGGDRCR